jgi:radical SAM superfamily enzyme YgiQ (UPF0313 family)
VVSRPAEEIIAEIEKLCRTGYEEAVLTGVETASYGKDFEGGYTLADLISDVAEKTEIKRIRLGSLEPSVLKKSFVDSIARIDKFMPSFHLSLQSGSNKVLADMKRKYNREMVLAYVEYIKSVMPDATFTCDIIVGFPGESEEEFLDTYDIAKRIGFLHMHVFPYSKREGTPAAVMPGQLPESVKNERVKHLMELDEALRRENAERFIGRTVEVLFETEKAPLSMGEYQHLKALALKSAQDFLTLYHSIPQKDATASAERKTFYGQVPRSANEMYEHTKSVNAYYFGEIEVDADNLGDIYECRNRGFEALETQSSFLKNTIIEGSYGEDWSLRKVIRRFIWHDRIHAKAMYRMAVKVFGAENIANPFYF